MKRAVVIGLGIFGTNIVKGLYEAGFDVIAIDKNSESVQNIRDFCTKAIVSDGRSKAWSDDIGLQEDDVVIISFGDDLAASTLITLNMKQAKVKTIIVKAPNDDHRMILEKVGASEVIIPEMEMASKVVKSLASPNVLDYLPLSDDYMIFEMAPPGDFLGKSLAELQLRGRYNIHVIAVRDLLTDRVHMVPNADFVVRDGQVLVVVGREADIRRII